VQNANEVANMQNHNTTEIDAATKIRLPNTCPQNRRSFTYVRMLTAVSAEAWNGAGFEGALFSPGSRISLAEVRQHPILLEFAGPSGAWKCRRNPENLWILWNYDFSRGTWHEIARAAASDWHWAVILREPAIRALRPQNASNDALDRGREVTERILAAMETTLSSELPAVRTAVLCSIYDQIAGRLAVAA
jgi:hypothetical protein